MYIYLECYPIIRNRVYSVIINESNIESIVLYVNDLEKVVNIDVELERSPILQIAPSFIPLFFEILDRIFIDPAIITIKPEK